MRKTLYITFCLNIVCMAGYAQRIKATGGWNNVISATSIAEAGNNYPVSVVTSLAAQTVIDIEGLNLVGGGNSKNFEVRVSGGQVVWNSNLQLSVLRTSNGVHGGGNPTGAIAGGTSYVSVSSFPTMFFNGYFRKEDYINGINVQYELTGLSVLVPAGTYTMNVVYNFVAQY